MHLLAACCWYIYWLRAAGVSIGCVWCTNWLSAAVFRYNEWNYHHEADALDQRRAAHRLLEPAILERELQMACKSSEKEMARKKKFAASFGEVKRKMPPGHLDMHMPGGHGTIPYETVMGIGANQIGAGVNHQSWNTVRRDLGCVNLVGNHRDAETNSRCQENLEHNLKKIGIKKTIDPETLTYCKVTDHDMEVLFKETNDFCWLEAFDQMCDRENFRTLFANTRSYIDRIRTDEPDLSADEIRFRGRLNIMIRVLMFNRQASLPSGVQLCLQLGDQIEYWKNRLLQSGLPWATRVFLETVFDSAHVPILKTTYERSNKRDSPDSPGSLARRMFMDSFACHGERERSGVCSIAYYGQREHKKREHNHTQNRRQRTDCVEEMPEWRIKNEPIHFGDGCDEDGGSDHDGEVIVVGDGDDHDDDVELIAQSSDAEDQEALPRVASHVAVSTLEQIRALLETEFSKLSPRDQRGLVTCNLETIDELLESDGDAASINAPSVGSLEHGEHDLCGTGQYKCLMVYNFSAHEIKFTLKDHSTNLVSHNIRIPFGVIANHVCTTTTNALDGEPTCTITIRVRSVGVKAYSHERINKKSTYSLISQVPPYDTRLDEHAVYRIQVNNSMPQVDQQLVQEALAACGSLNDAADALLCPSTKIPETAQQSVPASHHFSAAWPELPQAVCKELVTVALRKLVTSAQVLKDGWKHEDLTRFFQQLFSATLRTWKQLADQMVPIAEAADANRQFATAKRKRDQQVERASRATAQAKAEAHIRWLKQCISGSELLGSIGITKESRVETLPEFLSKQKQFWRSKRIQLESAGAAAETNASPCPARVCKCQKLFSSEEDYLECSGCDTWFHPACLSMTKTAASAAFRATRFKLDHGTCSRPLHKCCYKAFWFCPSCNPLPTLPAQAASGAATELSKGKRKRDKQEEESDEDEERFCICQMPDDGAEYISCDACDQWFHPGCVGASHGRKEYWHCPGCVAKNEPEPVCEKLTACCQQLDDGKFKLMCDACHEGFHPGCLELSREAEAKARSLELWRCPGCFRDERPMKRLRRAKRPN